MRGSRFVGWALVVAVVSGVPAAVQAASHFAVFVGSNRAPTGLNSLRHSHADARRMRDVFVELGGIPAENAVLLLDPGSEALRASLNALRARGAAEGAQRLLFYYSGHADQSALLLGEQTFPFAEIRAFLGDTRSEMRLALVDSCRSGALTQVKGGTQRPRVNIDWTFSQPVVGAVLITSSAAEESSVERDDIGGSLFSHFFVSGLRGSADENQDGKVTLEEGFNYAYSHTLARSAESRTGSQHPTYEYRISGRSQLVLTWLNQSSFISFGSDLAGTYLVFDRHRDQVVAELSKPPGVLRRLWLPSGDYYIKKRMPSSVLLQKVGLAKGAEHVVRDYEMSTVPYAEDVTKGGLSPIFRPTWRYGAPYVPHTANMLRRGELSLGPIVSRLGVSDNVMLLTSPVLDVLLIPNVGAKFRVLQREGLSWSARAGFLQSFLGRATSRDNRSTIALMVGTTLSWQVVPSLTLSLLSEWEMQSMPDHSSGVEWESQLVRAGFSVTWLLGEHDLVQLVGGGNYTFYGPTAATQGILDWEGRLVYAHAWDVFRVELGVSRSTKITDNLEYDFAIVPVVDLWWRW